MKTFHITEERVQDDIYASQAKTADTEPIMSLLYRTAAWLNSKGSTQWNELLQGVDVHGMAVSIAKGDVFVFKRDGVPAAVVMLLQQPSAWDRELWSSLGDKGEAGHGESIYLHRLAIDRAFAGSQLGHAVLRWAETGIRFPGKRRLRLDCKAGVPALNAFYRAAGYTFQGEIPKGYLLFEKELPPQ